MTLGKLRQLYDDMGVFKVKGGADFLEILYEWDYTFFEVLADKALELRKKHNDKKAKRVCIAQFAYWKGFIDGVRDEEKRH